jgi:hypothetical protein
MAQPQHCLTWQHTTDQERGPSASVPVSHSCLVRPPSPLFSSCSNALVLTIPGGPLCSRTRPSPLEHWISVNEARILSQAANRQQHFRKGQRSIDEYSPPPYPNLLSFLHERICFSSGLLIAYLLIFDAPAHL